ncbi:hypothetical protein [Laspinema olomoucense]|uniref:hypothetical protein n=1 Tax=Laspinema olomoucense TaxID=3231600 RepID=UPI0021BAD34E|nr:MULTISPECIES: hypothetical protein [unclassified Laspinema]MCT7972592.1 hypothetical protein [Laspinema sp. D3d]MCT7989301.1 hypothetical protein [Laspinema sp. D3a]
MGLKIVQNFGGSFTLNPEAKSVLFELLNSPEFVQQVALAAQCSQVEFTELMFQPVPYSEQTPKGMPPEFESYHESDDYLIINVPPNFMFKAKIFNPSRICVVYRKLS